MPGDMSVGYRLFQEFVDDPAVHQRILETTDASRFGFAEPSFEHWFQVEFAVWLKNRHAVRKISSLDSTGHRQSVADTEAALAKSIEDPCSFPVLTIGESQTQLIAYKREPSHHIGGKRGDFSLIFRTTDTPGAGPEGWRLYKEILELKHNSTEIPNLEHKVKHSHYGEGAKYGWIEYTGIAIQSTATSVDLQEKEHIETKSPKVMEWVRHGDYAFSAKEIQRGWTAYRNKAFAKFKAYEKDGGKKRLKKAIFDPGPPPPPIYDE